MDPIIKYKFVVKKDSHGHKYETIEPYVPFGGSWKNQITNMSFEKFAELLNIAYTQGVVDALKGNYNQPK